MLTAGIEFLPVNQMGTFFIFDTWIKRHCDNEQIAQVISGTRLVLCVDKRFVWFSCPR